MLIHYGIHKTNFGWSVVGVSEGKVCALSFIASNSRKSAVAELKRSYPGATLVRSDSATKHYVTKTFTRGFARPLPLHIDGTEFQKSVWSELRKIPHGKTASYAEIANQIGSPRAARAVGTACGKNKIGVIIPCHRVVSTSGKLGGYRWGLDRKKKLLRSEGVSIEE